MTELKELKEHIRWLEDDRLDAGAVEKRLDQIDGDLEQLFDACNRITDAMNSHSEWLSELLAVLTGRKEPAPLFSPAAKLKFHKAKLLLVRKDGDDGDDGDDGPGGAS